MWVGIFLASLGLNAYAPTLPLYLAETFDLQGAENERWTGLAFGAAPLAAALCGPFWGALGDRVGRKLMAVRAIAGVAVVSALLPLARTPLEFVFLRVLQGLLSGYMAPALSLVSVSVPQNLQSRVVGRLHGSFAIGLLTGPALGAEVARGFGREWVFWFTAIAAAVGCLAIMFGAREDRALLKPKDGSGLKLFQALAGFLRRPIVGPLLLLFAFVRFGQQLAEVFIPLWFEEIGLLEWLPSWGGASGAEAQTPDRSAAAVLSLQALGLIFFASRWAALGERYGPLRILAIATFVQAVTCALCGLFPDPDTFFVLRGLYSFALAATFTLALAAIGKRVEPENRSLAFGCVQSCFHIGMFLGPVTGGFAAAGLGLGGVFVSAGVSLFLAGCAMLWVRSIGLRARPS